MEDLDDYFEYALDQPEVQRAELLASLRHTDPAMATRLEAMLRELATNPDFACHGSSLHATTAGPASVRAVTLRVGDLSQAVAWYADVFRCRIVRQDAARAVVAFANLELHLVVGLLDPPGLCVHKTDVARLGATARRADGSRTMHLVDPWGNPFEVTDAAADLGGEVGQ